MSIEAMKAALEVLEGIGLKTEKMQNAIDLLRQALAQPKREWVGLTDEEMRALKQKSVDDGMTRIVTDFEYIRSIEAKLKEKNCG